MRQDRDETVPKFFIRILYEIESLSTFKIETKTLILQWSSVRLLGKLLIVIPLKRGSTQKWNSSRWFPPNCSYGSTDLPAMPATILMSVEFFSAPLRGIGLRGGLGMDRSVPQLLLWIQKQKGSLHTKNGPQICLEPIQKLDFLRLKLGPCSTIFLGSKSNRSEVSSHLCIKMNFSTLTNMGGKGGNANINLCWRNSLIMTAPFSIQPNWDFWRYLTIFDNIPKFCQAQLQLQLQLSWKLS